MAEEHTIPNTEEPELTVTDTKEPSEDGKITESEDE